MVNKISSLINELPLILRKPTCRQNYVDKFLHELQIDEVKCYAYAAKALSIVCQDIQKNRDVDDQSLQGYTNFIIAISSYVNDETYEKFILQNLKFFVYYLLNKNADKQLKSYLKQFVITKIFCKDSYRIYFDIVKNVQFYLLQKDTQSSDLSDSEKIECCFRNLQKCMEMTDEDQFLQFFKELFDHESSFNTMYKNGNYCKKFMSNCFNSFKNIKTISVLEEFFILVTNTFIFFNKYELVLESKIIWSIELLKAVVENPQIKNNTYNHYALTLLLYLSSLRVKEFSQSNLEEILRKQLKLMENNINENWYYDLQLTLIQFFSRNTNCILNDIKTENLKIFIEIIYKIIKNFSNISYTKRNCSNCKNYKVHEIVNLFLILVDVYKQIINNDYEDEKFLYILQHILECIIKTYSNIIQCKNMKTLFINKLSFLKMIISKLKSVKLAKQAVDIIDSLNTDALIQELQDKIIYIKLYLHLYTLLEDKKLILQSYASILNLLSNKDENNLNSYMFSFIKQLIDLDLTNITIKEVIRKSESKFLDEKFINNVEYINFLTKKQIEISISFKLLPNDKIEYLIEKIMDENYLTELEFVMITRSLEQFIKSKKIQKALEDAKISNEKQNDNMEKYLILGHLYKYEAVKEFENSKSSLDLKITTEENLTDINISDFKKINLEKECEIIKPAINSLNYFKRIYEDYDLKYDKQININAILDDLSYLARNFHLRGYLDYAANSWLLVYKFADKGSKNELQKIRAISFFCKNVHYNFTEKYKINLETELTLLSEILLEQYKKIDSLSPRKQNYVLLCLLNIAYYYNYNNDIESFQSLLIMVQEKINNMEHRKNKFEFVRAHLFAMELNFRTKNFAKLTVSPYLFISQVLKELKEIVYITSEDSLNMSCFLIEFLEDIASYLLAMLDTKMVIPYITSVLTFSFKYGITLRITKIFTIWIKINLQNEDLFNTQLKLLILEKLLLENINNKSVDKYYNEAIKLKKVENNVNVNLSASIEGARKAIQSISLAEDFELYPKNFEDCDFLKYLIEHNKKCICKICQYPIYKFIIFEIGCFYSEMCFLKNDCNTIRKKFIEEALKWWSKNDNSKIKILFEETLYYLYLDYIKCLRIDEKFSEAIDFCETASKIIENNKNLNNNLIWKIMEHYCSIQSNSKSNEVIILESPTVKTKQRGRPRKVVKI